MSFYYDFDSMKFDKARVADRLLALREQIQRSNVPKRTLDETLLLATWNIREFDSSSHGERMDESFFYIAEIVSHFDIVAIQEIRGDLKALEKLCKILGSYWKYVVTDVTEGVAGNKERMAFLFDGRKMRFSGLTGEIVIAPVKKGGRTYEPARQLARTPFICGFQAGWFKFMLCTVHIRYGSDKAVDRQRLEEITLLTKMLGRRVRQKTAWCNNLILLGDFNIFNPRDVTFEALTKQGFVVPEQLQKMPSNAGKNKHYDQIAFNVKEKRMELSNAGILDFYQSVFREEDQDLYVAAMGQRYFKSSSGKSRDAKSKTRYFRNYWRTHQMSDHLPMWVELKVDFGKDYLQSMKKE